MTQTAAVAPPTSTSQIQIRPFQPADAPAFFALNEQWISRHFGMEDRDHLNLGNPQQSILDPGGHILMAFAGDRPVGCCALIPEHAAGPQSKPVLFELAKMAVAEDLRGQGIGRRVLVAAIHLARSIGARRLTLGSNSKLPAAVHLYESVGFTHIPPERRPPSLYARADVFMEMDL
ncbi:MAG: hypothetical protein NVSMB3_09130 [Acidobacteriaceae bacterium]